MTAAVCTFHSPRPMPTPGCQDGLRFHGRVAGRVGRRGASGEMRESNKGWCLCPFGLLSQNTTAEVWELTNSGSLFLTVQEAGHLRSRCQQGWVLRALSGLQMAVFSLCEHVVEGAGQLPGVPSTKAQAPFRPVPPSRPRHLPKAPSHGAITLGFRIHCKNIGETPPSDHSR